MAEEVQVDIVEDKIPLLIARVEATARAAVKRTADNIARSAQMQAPVLTGYLRDSIVSSSLSIGYEAEVHVGAYYGYYVEYGTRFMAAQPFLGPAIDEHDHEMPEEIMVSLEAPL